MLELVHGWALGAGSYTWTIVLSRNMTNGFNRYSYAKNN